MSLEPGPVFATVLGSLVPDGATNLKRGVVGSSNVPGCFARPGQPASSPFLPALILTAVWCAPANRPVSYSLTRGACPEQAREVRRNFRRAPTSPPSRA